MAPYTYPYAAHHLFKREAEAEPEADSQVLLNNYAYNAGVLPYSAGVLPYAHHTYAHSYIKPAVTYMAPYTYPYAAHHLFKREAEAEPEADSQVLLNNYAYNAGVLPYSAGVLPYAHHTYAHSYIKPAVTYKAPVVYKAPLTT